MPQTFDKTPTDVKAQIDLLRQRGLIINDEALAIHYLTNVGYYRLAGHWVTLQKDTVKHIFYEGQTFENVIHIYNFDRALRLLIFSAIERIEVGFRSQLSNSISAIHGAFWFENAALFDHHFQDNLATIDKELFRSKEDFIKHHKNKYGRDRPPCWKTLEVMSLGNLSMLYASLKSPAEKNIVAHNLALPNYVYLESWMQSLSTLRNCCAHHCRIWNKVFEFPPKKLATSKQKWIKKIPATHRDTQLIYFQLCTIKYLLNVVNPTNSFAAKLNSIITKFPTIDIVKLGFANGWELEPLWETKPKRETTNIVP